MSVLRITKHGEEVLKKPSKPFDFGAMKKDLPALLRDMWATMYAARGVGLAAPQIGLNVRVAVIDVRPDDKPQRLTLINPEILSKEGELQEEEGCLSIPGLYAPVKRSARVRIRAMDQHGRSYEVAGQGLLARAFQHEIDHLDGKLFIDRLPLGDRLKVSRLIKDLRARWA